MELGLMPAVFSLAKVCGHVLHHLGFILLEICVQGRQAAFVLWKRTWEQ